MSLRKIAICDDEDIERDMLDSMLRDCDKNQLIYPFSSGEELLSSSEEFDLVFMDIYMKGMTGMETAKRLRQKKSKAPIVFLTSSSDFALESYEVHAFDYILKPLQPDRLRAVWERYCLEHREPKFILLNNAGKTEKLPYDKIEYLGSDCHYVTVHLADGTDIRLHGRLDELEARLDDGRFLRCHKSFLINMHLAKAMEEDFIMQSGAGVPYRKRDKKALQRIFDEFMSRKA